MSESFSTYPVLQEQCFATIGYVSDKPECRYTEGYEEYSLQLDGNENSLAFSGKLKDPRCTWYPDTHNLIFSKACQFTSAFRLFGMGGVTASESVLGVALRWISSKSDERGVIPFGEITRKDSAISFSVEAQFDKGKLKGTLKYQTILYLKKAAEAGPDERYFAQQEGTVLGVLDHGELYVDGNGSVFPIVTVNLPGKPLWQVYFNDTANPLQDAFDSENVEIRLNKAHPNFESLKIDSSLAESTLFLEVLSSAMMVIVEAAKELCEEDWEEVMNGYGYESGSIAEAIHYFHSKLQWDMTSAPALSSSIREFFEKNS